MQNFRQAKLGFTILIIHWLIQQKGHDFLNHLVTVISKKLNVIFFNILIN